MYARCIKLTQIWTVVFLRFIEVWSIEINILFSDVVVVVVGKLIIFVLETENFSFCHGAHVDIKKKVCFFPWTLFFNLATNNYSSTGVLNDWTFIISLIKWFQRIEGCVPDYKTCKIFMQKMKDNIPQDQSGVKFFKKVKNLFFFFINSSRDYHVNGHD